MTLEIRYPTIDFRESNIFFVYQKVMFDPSGKRKSVDTKKLPRFLTNPQLLNLQKPPFFALKPYPNDPILLITFEKKQRWGVCFPDKKGKRIRWKRSNSYHVSIIKFHCFLANRSKASQRSNIL
jgi:hypothetical protein